MKKTVFDKIIAVYAWLSFFLSLIIALTTVFASVSGEKNGREVFGVKLLIVASDSMSRSPTSENEEIFFNSGDLIVVGRVEDTSLLSVGDVITFFSYNPESYGETVTHKIREVRYGKDGNIIGFVTYGINKGVNDTALVKPENVIGKYIFKVADIGRLFAFLKTPHGYFISILIPAVLLITFFSIKVGKALGKKDFGLDYGEEIANLNKRLALLEEQLRDRSDGAAASDTEPPDLSLDGSSVPVELIAEPEELPYTGLNIPRGKRASFSERLSGFDESIQSYFETVHKELLSYKRVRARLSFKCISYRQGRRLLAKMTVSGKTLRLHLSLDTNAFDEKIFFQKDFSGRSAYSEVPFTVKIKSSRGEKRAVRLVLALAEKHGLVKAVSLSNKQDILLFTKENKNEN